MASSVMSKFIAAMEYIYGPFTKDIKGWNPLPLSEGHGGRYLWTDGFAVLNFLTLYKDSKDDKYITCAKKLVDKVHSVLGYTRDGRGRLPHATEEWPLLGGLRIGKLEESGDDGDGQYFHYLTVWMFALHQMGKVTRNRWYVDQVLSMAKAVYPHFVYGMESKRPRMYWKMTMDLEQPLVMSEGNLDPIDGYVTYSLLDEEGRKLGSDVTLEEEIAVFRKIVDAKYKSYGSNDPLDLGMTLWTTHWMKDKEDWAASMTDKAMSCLWRVVNDRKYFDRPVMMRLAFREFGTVLGLRCHKESQEGNDLINKILHQWEVSGAVPIPKSSDIVEERLQAITSVMYATALNAAAFRQDFGA